MVVAEASYELSEPTIDSKILKIKDAGTDLFFSASTPKQAAQAIKKIAELGWHPVHIIDINAFVLERGAQACGTRQRRKASSASATSRIRPIPSGRTMRG